MQKAEDVKNVGENLKNMRKRSGRITIHLVGIKKEKKRKTEERGRRGRNNKNNREKGSYLIFRRKTPN